MYTYLCFDFQKGIYKQDPGLQALTNLAFEPRESHDQAFWNLNKSAGPQLQLFGGITAETAMK